MKIHELLAEASRNPIRPVPGKSLFHGTGVLGAAQILADNHLKSSEDQFGQGVSLTDARDSAEYFAVRHDTEDAAQLALQKSPDRQEGDEFHYYSDEAQEEFPHLTGVVLELDTAALQAAGYRIKAVSYDYDWEDEEEWRVMGGAGITPLRQFLRAVHVKPAVVRWWAENHPEYTEALRALKV